MNLENFYGRFFDGFRKKEVNLLYAGKLDEAKKLAKKAQLIYDKSMKAARYGA